MCSWCEHIETLTRVAALNSCWWTQLHDGSLHLAIDLQSNSSIDAAACSSVATAVHCESRLTSAISLTAYVYVYCTVIGSVGIVRATRTMVQQLVPEVSVRAISGASDHIGPSVSLHVTLQSELGLRQHREYLFGVGSGIARAGLEHKCRPSRHLRATFSCTLDSSRCGGLGGLVLRLRADGHGKVCRLHSLESTCNYKLGRDALACQTCMRQHQGHWSYRLPA